MSIAKDPSDCDVPAPSAVESRRSTEQDRSDDRIQHEAKSGLRAPCRLAPVVERVTAFKPRAGIDRSAHEIWQPAERAKITTGRRVVVIAR